MCLNQKGQNYGSSSSSSSKADVNWLRYGVGIRSSWRDHGEDITEVYCGAGKLGKENTFQSVNGEKKSSDLIRVRIV